MKVAIIGPSESAVRLAARLAVSDITCKAVSSEQCGATAEWADLLILMDTPQRNLAALNSCSPEARAKPTLSATTPDEENGAVAALQDKEYLKVVLGRLAHAIEEGF
ncbi:MAG: hypothetical protein H6707_21110 [Deltaproteobacteria bacterium]|nr:hypothetical protein [Myxococcales bacterium]MCB9558630.1 hypothetical protein [Deltaproteobacteria bacterium]